ncbi:MAG: radical SAM family heme chaperone HemW [Clostridia bacterium]|nr:radical SAM family heme chaperone HemW [Clostridia bacterium]
MSTSIYIHIPFCASKCKYCDFYSAPASEEIREKYVSALISQINSSSALNESVKSVYFGGGTPSVLTEKQLYSVLEALDKKFNISSAEKTLEVNPDSVLTAKSEKALWFNRFSMGVQSFDDEELRLLGRRHTAEEAEKAYLYLRNFASNVNLDLIIGIPSENHSERLKRSLDKLISLNPEHSSVYILKYEEGTPMYSYLNSALPDDEVSDLYLYVSETMRNNGYEHYEISNYAKKGFRSVHNCAYWEQKKYLAFGTGAYGFDGKNRYHFEKNVSEYIALNGQVLPITDEILEAPQIFEEKVILGLRMSDGISENIYADICKNPAKKRFCENLIKNNMANILPDGSFVLTPKGWLVSNTIIEDLI